MSVAPQPAALTPAFMGLHPAARITEETIRSRGDQPEATGPAAPHREAIGICGERPLRELAIQPLGFPQVRVIGEKAESAGGDVRRVIEPCRIVAGKIV